MHKLRMSDLSYWSYDDFLKNIKVTKFADGTNTVCVYPPRPPTGCKSEVLPIDRQERNKRMNKYRRTKAIHYCVRQIVADRLLTLTVRENLTDIKTASRLFREFCETAKRHGVIKKYVGVFERQKRGAWHLHIALGEYVNISKARFIWQHLLGKKGYEGQVNVTQFRGGSKKRTRGLAGYLCKYLTKESELNYIRSRNIEEPKIECYSVYMSLDLLTEMQRHFAHVEVVKLDHGVYYFYIAPDELLIFTESIIPKYL